LVIKVILLKISEEPLSSNATINKKNQVLLEFLWVIFFTSFIPEYSGMKDVYPHEITKNPQVIDLKSFTTTSNNFQQPQ